jgi:hypothetical protein
MAGRDPTLTTPLGLPAWSRQASIGDYDGSTDKEDTTTETTPYAWVWYLDYTSMLGTAFTSDRTGIVHAKKIAIARMECGKQRAVERAICNSMPATADELLGDWATIMSIPVYPEDEKWQIRERCAAKLSAPCGASFTQIDDSLRALLGGIYVQSFRTTGASLASPPPHTFWSGHPGAPGLSLGAGTWSSERSRLTVQVQLPPDAELSAFLRTVNVVLFQHLDRALPAFSNFGWTAWNGTPGFHLDISPLDLTGITPS